MARTGHGEDKDFYSSEGSFKSGGFCRQIDGVTEAEHEHNKLTKTTS